MVVTATSFIKVWLKNMPPPQIEMKEPLTVAPPPKNGISTSQLATVLLLTIFANLAITHYQDVTRPCVAIVINWMMAMIQLYKVRTNVSLVEVGLLILGQTSSPAVGLKATSNSTLAGPDFSGLE